MFFNKKSNQETVPQETLVQRINASGLCGYDQHSVARSIQKHLSLVTSEKVSSVVAENVEKALNSNHYGYSDRDCSRVSSFLESLFICTVYTSKISISCYGSDYQFVYDFHPDHMYELIEKVESTDFISDSISPFYNDILSYWDSYDLKYMVVSDTDESRKIRKSLGLE